MGKKEYCMELAAIFKEGMVLQQKKTNRIWGCASTGEKIEIDFLDKHYIANNVDENWYIDIEPEEAGGPFEMTITSNLTGELVLGDILIGEVWLAGGQSNMELELQNSDDGINVCKNSNFDRIRFYNVPKYAKVDDELIKLEKDTCWKKAEGMQIADVSAVAYYFAQ